jgi:hypothetical protein
VHIIIALLVSATSLVGAPRSARILTAVDGKRPRAKHQSVRVDTPVTLYASVRYKGRRYTDAPIRGARKLKGARFVWSRVEPRLHHTDTPAPNGRNPAYSNSRLFGPQHGKWLGYDNIEYFSTLLPGHNGSSLRVTQASPTDKRLNAGAGTMRYQVQVFFRGQIFASAGVESVGRQGILDSVRRVSFRQSDDLAGYLTAYFNVPNLFGSAGHGSTHQTDRFQGADCADVIVGAARLGGARVDYTHAAGLTRYARPVGELLKVDHKSITLAETGAPAHLIFGTDVRRGDLVLIDYHSLLATKRRWDHVGVIANDGGVRGRFDPKDTMLHMAYLKGLREQTLGSRPAATIQILRLKPHIARRIGRRR